jgi:uncharacterized membrane protein
MRNFIAVVFDDKAQAYGALHELWQLDFAGQVTVHGTTVVHRDHRGHILVDSKETHPVFATAVGVGIGALLGCMAGPAGIAVGIAEGAAIGAATGAVIGGTIDLERSDTRAQALVDAGFVLGRGKSALIADISEDWNEHLDSRMESRGGSVHRRSRSSVQNDSRNRDGPFPFDNYLYPYEYVPAERAAFSGW